MMRDPDIEPSGHNEAETDNNERNVSNAKSEDMERIVAEFVEGGIGEAIDYGEDGGADVFEERCPPKRDLPVVTEADD